MSSYFELLEPRRCAIVRDASPVFVEHGYRHTTIRMLSSSCHLSSGGLYHHFGSKLRLALFPILARENIAHRCQTILRATYTDPLVRLRAYIDEGLKGSADFALAIQLAEDSGSRTLVEPVLRSIFRQATATYAVVALEAAPLLGRARATEFGEAALAVALSSDIPGHRMSVPSLSALLYALVERYVIPAGVARERFAQVFGVERISSH